MRTQLILFIGAFALANAAVSAPGCACAGTEQLLDGAVSAALSGNTVCVPNGGTDWFWQEQHRTSLDLFDFKKGSDPVDPTEEVGTWATSGSGVNSVVTHSYLGGSSFAYKVCRAGASTTYGFCPTVGGATIFATIKAGISGCP